MSPAIQNLLESVNPANGRVVGTVRLMPPKLLPLAVADARKAQGPWWASGWRVRRAFLESWGRVISERADAFAGLIRDEVGKPRTEALAADVIGTLDGLRWTVRHGKRALAPRWFPAGHQRMLLMPGGRMTHQPVGVVGMIGTWNYPLFLNAIPIAQALAAGNAVVWKPSELAPLTGAWIQKSLEEAGMPKGLVTTLHGGADVGQALVESDIDKGVFTGGVANGRRVLAALAARGVPAVAELSGYDPAIVLPDAPFDATIRALTWSAFVGAGQTCVAVKRVYIVGEDRPWAEALAAAANALRVGDPASDQIDMGPLISVSARDRFHAFITAAVEAGAEVLAGGRAIDGIGSFYTPTVLRCDSPVPEDVLAGAFGPVVIVRGVADADAAVTAANRSDFGLAASVWGRDRRAASSIADRLLAGSVGINEAVTPTMHASAPFGGVKASGFGRTHGAIGLLEFTQPRVVFRRAAGGFRPHLFPYGKAPLDAFLQLYRRLFHF